MSAALSELAKRRLLREKCLSVMEYREWRPVGKGAGIITHRVPVSVPADVKKHDDRPDRGLQIQGLNMTFQQQLDSTIAKWNSGDVDDEWLFQRLREKQIGQMASEEAWAQIDECVTKLLYEENESTAIELIETIIALARQSTTTELPKEIASSSDRLKKQFSSYGEYAKEQLRQMFRYYRI